MEQNNTNNQPVQTLPVQTLKQLFKATAIALIAAVILLTAVILPAEYDIDPTGVGSALGLTALNVEDSDANSPMQLDGNTPAVIAASQPGTWKSDQLSIVIEPYDGVELKALMRQGEQFVFSWATDGNPVFVDMHGEEPEAGDDVFTSYWKEKQQHTAQGVLIAPFNGTHGWYWQNMGEDEITITLNISGFYQKLFRP